MKSSFRPNYACDKLDPYSKDKLDRMMSEIDDNLDALQEEKKEYFKIDGDQSVSKVSRITDATNVFSIGGDYMKAMQDLDQKLSSVNPNAVSNQLHQSEMKSSKDFDSQSQFSMPMSGVSRRSNFTTFTLQSKFGKSKTAPKEGVLKESHMSR